MQQILRLTPGPRGLDSTILFSLIATAMLGCHSGRSERPTPEAKRAMDSAMTAVRDSGGPDTTASDSTPR